jgi:hypothetical protein
LTNLSVAILPKLPLASFKFWSITGTFKHVWPSFYQEKKVHQM